MTATAVAGQHRTRSYLLGVAALAATLLPGACGREADTADAPRTQRSSTSVERGDRQAHPTTSAATVTSVREPVLVGTSIPDALATGITGQVTLAGYLVIDEGAARLCAQLLEVEPPACGGMSVSVKGPVDHPGLSAEGAVRWSATQVDLSGNFSGSVLQADGPPTLEA